MFGPVMQFDVGETGVKLAPIKRDDMALFVENGGMQHYSVTRYLGRDITPVLEDEHEWYDNIRGNGDRNWGIFVRESDDSWRLIGNTALHISPSGYVRAAVSGCLIFDSTMWGKGIISRAHMARTMFAFDELNLSIVKSEVMDVNVGSSRALTKIGYVPVSRERNISFVGGKWVHATYYELVNPSPHSWQAWWHGDTVPKAFREARKRTMSALDWARNNVELL